MASLKLIVQEVAALCDRRKLKLATAESCTGGMIASAITDKPGSSSMFDYGFVTYANKAKIDLLGVNPRTLELKGAVSRETACEMAEGARIRAHADFGLSTTGIAGPTGGTPEKPVGLVYIGLSSHEGTQAQQFHFLGSREEVREQATLAAMEMLLSALNT